MDGQGGSFEERRGGDVLVVRGNRNGRGGRRAKIACVMRVFISNSLICAKMHISEHPSLPNRNVCH